MCVCVCVLFFFFLSFSFRWLDDRRVSPMASLLASLFSNQLGREARTLERIRTERICFAHTSKSVNSWHVFFFSFVFLLVSSDSSVRWAKVKLSGSSRYLYLYIARSRLRSISFSSFFSFFPFGKWVERGVWCNDRVIIIITFCNIYIHEAYVLYSSDYCIIVKRISIWSETLARKLSSWFLIIIVQL